MKDLKRVLMELGNRLVIEHGFLPAAHKGFMIPPSFNQPETRSTHLIAELTDFLNKHEEAQRVLADMGFDWPVTKQQQKESADLRVGKIARDRHQHDGERTPEAVEMATVFVMARENQNHDWASDYVSSLSTQDFVRTLEQAKA